MSKKKEERTKAIRKKVLMFAAIIATMPILVVTIKNGVHAVRTAVNIKHIDEQAALYQSDITADSLLLEQVKSDEGLIKFAREKYFMQYADEEVYVVE